MDLGYIHCQVALDFGRSRDYSARGNEVLSPVHDYMCTWDLPYRWSYAETYVHLSDWNLTLDDSITSFLWDHVYEKLNSLLA